MTARSMWSSAGSPAQLPRLHRSLPPELSPLGLTRLQSHELRQIFDRLSSGAATGETKSFGAAGAASLLEDARRLHAAEVAAGGWPTKLPARALQLSAGELVSLLDRDGDGVVSWDDFISSVDDAAEVVDKRVMFVAGSLLFNFVAQGAAMPTIPLLGRELGFTTAEVGFVTSAAAMSRLLCNIPMAWLCEKVGRRPLLIAGPSISAVSIACFGFSGSYSELVCWNTAFGVGSSMTAAASMLYLNDVATPKNRSRTMAPTTVTALLGFASGPMLAGLLAETYGLSSPFLFCGGGMTLAAAAAFAFLPETRLALKERYGAAALAPLPIAQAAEHRAAADSGRLKEQPFMGQMWTLLQVPNLQGTYVASFSTGTMHGSFPISILYMSESLGMTPSVVGGYFAACVLTMAASTPIASKLADRAPSRKYVMAPGTLITAMGSAVQPFCSTAETFFGVGLIGAVANSFVMPNMSAMVGPPMQL